MFRAHRMSPAKLFPHDNTPAPSRLPLHAARYAIPAKKPTTVHNSCIFTNFWSAARCRGRHSKLGLRQDRNSRPDVHRESPSLHNPTITDIGHLLTPHHFGCVLCSTQRPLHARTPMLRRSPDPPPVDRLSCSTYHSVSSRAGRARDSYATRRLSLADRA